MYVFLVVVVCLLCCVVERGLLLVEKEEVRLVIDYDERYCTLRDLLSR